MSTFVIVLTTWPADAEVESLCRTLVEERLVACVNVLAPMLSVYRWQGTVEQASERQLIMKTAAGRIEALNERLAQLHPYEVPEFLVVPVADGGAAYFRWIAESTAQT